MDSKKMLIGIFSMFIVAMLVLTGCNNGPTGQVVQNTDKPTITIGVSAVLTGDMSNLGQSFANSAKLAIKELPSDTKYNYKIVIEDDRLDGKTEISVMQKFITVDKVDAVISFSSGMGNIVSPIADENNLLHCSVASDPNIAKGKNNFIHWTTPQEENRVMVKALQDRGAKNIGIIALNQQGVQATVADLKSRAPEAGLTLDVVTYNGGEKDFKTILLKLQEKKPDYIMLLMFSPELELATKQYHELGMTTPITAIESFEYTDQPELFNGQWYVQGADALSEFRDTYTTEYSDSHKLGGPNAYDCVNLIVQSFETAGDGTTKPSTESVVKAFGNIKNFNGAVGPLSVDENHIVQSEAVVRQVKNGQFITLSEVTAKELSSKKTIKIGLSAPLTGEAASFGQNQLAGAELAVKELNDNGGILGRPVELIVEDDQCGSKAVSTMTKLITVDNVVGIVGPVCSSAAGPSLPVTTEYNTPTVIFASAPQLLSAGNNVFRVYPSDALQGAAGAEILYNKLGAKKVALLYVENDWGKGIQKVFKEKYEALGGEIVYITGVLPTEKDYKTTLLKVQASGAEGVYLPLYPNQMVPTLKQMKELGIEVPIVSGDVFAADEVIKSGYANGAIYVQGKTDISEEFKGRIHSLPEFKNLDINLMTVYGYDGVMVMAKAIENAGTNKDDVIAALHETHYRGQSQSLIEFGDDRELKNAVFQYMTIVDNTAVEYK